MFVREQMKARLKQSFSKIVNSRLPRNALLSASGLAGKFMPLPRPSGVAVLDVAGANDPMVVPPRELWENYGATPAEYLESGLRDVATMLDILGRCTGAPPALRQALDLGCASGRMLRFLPRGASDEHWGVDINARHIAWCNQHLNPPMLFATTTTAPHLPFEDRYFDLVYCGSLFTHIAELTEAWLLEVGRMLRPGGLAYITIHTRHTMERRLTLRPQHLREHVEMLDRIEAQGLRSRAWSSFLVGVDPFSQVYHDADQLRLRWGRVWDVLDIVEEAYGLQAAIVLRKRSSDNA